MIWTLYVSDCITPTLSIHIRNLKYYVLLSLNFKYFVNKRVSIKVQNTNSYKYKDLID